jgi:hypothetical protein
METASETQGAFRRVAKKLPVLGQHQNDERVKQAQTDWFTAQHPDGFIEEEPTIAGYLRSLVPSFQTITSYIVDTFPFVNWICNYNLQWFIGDLIAGVTVGAVVIPQASMAAF